MLPVMLKFSAFWLERFSKSHFLPKMDTHNMYTKQRQEPFLTPFQSFLKKCLKRSIGIGKSIVEFFSVAISARVCK